MVQTGTYGCFCGFKRWRATRCNFKRGSARPSLFLYGTEDRCLSGSTTTALPSGITLELVNSRQTANLARREADMALRHQPPETGDFYCEGAVVQAPAPERPLTGGIATEAVLALVAKYSDHLPLYRQRADLCPPRHRSRPFDWRTGSGVPAGGCAPLAELLRGSILSSPKIFADDTPVPVLDPGRGRTKTGRLSYMPVMTGRGRGHCPRRSPMSIARTVRACTRRATSPSSPGYCRSTAMPGSTV